MNKADLFEVLNKTKKYKLALSVRLLKVSLLTLNAIKFRAYLFVN